MTVTSFADNFLWSYCRRHLVGQSSAFPLSSRILARTRVDP